MLYLYYVTYMSSCNKNPKDTQPYNNAWHPIYLLWIFRHRLLVPKNPRPDRIFPCWHLPNGSRPDIMIPRWFLRMVEGWIAKKMIEIKQFDFHFGLQFWSSSFCWNHIFWDGSCCRRKTLWIGFFDPPRSNISTYQIIAMTFTTFQSYQTLTVPEVGRWTYAKRLGWKLFHAATSNLVCEQDFDSFEGVLGVFCWQYL